MESDRLNRFVTKEMCLDEMEIAALDTDIKAVPIQHHVLAHSPSTRLYLFREGR